MFSDKLETAAAATINKMKKKQHRRDPSQHNLENYCKELYSPPKLDENEERKSFF